MWECVRRQGAAMDATVSSGGALLRAGERVWHGRAPPPFAMAFQASSPLSSLFLSSSPLLFFLGRCCSAAVV